MIPHSALGETRREVRGMISDQKWAKTFQVLFTKSESILHLYQSIGLLKSHMPSLPKTMICSIVCKGSPDLLKIVKNGAVAAGKE